VVFEFLSIVIPALLSVAFGVAYGIAVGRRLEKTKKGGLKNGL